MTIASNWRGVRGTLAERFERHYIPEPNSGCWLWTGAALANGYGNIYINDAGKKRTLQATHVSLMLAGRQIPAGMLACHHCDNPSCVNPDHLFMGTHKDNSCDASQKGRLAGFQPPAITAAAQKKKYEAALRCGPEHMTETYLERSGKIRCHFCVKRAYARYDAKRRR